MWIDLGYGVRHGIVFSWSFLKALYLKRHVNGLVVSKQTKTPSPGCGLIVLMTGLCVLAFSLH